MAKREQEAGAGGRRRGKREQEAGAGGGSRGKKTQPGGRPLSGRVAIVAGATRGAGRGIARGLGEAGATVYCTGRSVRGTPSPYSRPETIEETAELVTAAGGTGIPVQVDHTDDAEIRRLVARVDKEQGRLDVLVNSLAGEDPTLAWSKPWAKLDFEQATTLMRHAVISHLITATYAAPLMMRTKRGLIVEVTEGDTFVGGATFLHGVVKMSLKMLALLFSEELRKHKIAVVAVTPGFLRSESMLAHFRVTEATWRDGGRKNPNFLESESPLFIGRGIAALAADPKALDLSGHVTSSWELGRRYGVVDADGRRPDWGEHFLDLGPSYKWLYEGFAREAAWLNNLARRAERYARPNQRENG